MCLRAKADATIMKSSEEMREQIESPTRSSWNWANDIVVGPKRDKGRERTSEERLEWNLSRCSAAELVDFFNSHHSASTRDIKHTATRKRTRAALFFFGLCVCVCVLLGPSTIHCYTNFQTERKNSHFRLN